MEKRKSVKSVAPWDGRSLDDGWVATSRAKRNMSSDRTQLEDVSRLTRAGVVVWLVNWFGLVLLWCN